ncbi:MAG: bifunctional riboflavin kinase/FAD synthetase, partial [Myxococcota bacterium]
NFDGVHRGHQRLLEETLSAAARLGGDSVVLTFDPHPAQVLTPDRAPPLLCTRERKLELLAAAGISVCVVEPFDRALAALSPDQFVQTILCQVIGAKHVVVGYDFTYGNKRAGTTETLRQFGSEHGFTVTVIEPVAVDEVVASSTRIRELVGAGEVGQVRTLLGRAHDVDGVVVRGAGRGRTIGVPTANIQVADGLLPAAGVYAVWARVLDGSSERLAGAANLGVNPTFTAAGQLSLEVHLLDFSGDLYDKPMRVEFVQRLRGEQRFDGVDALVAQIHADIARAREILDRHTETSQ